MEASDGLSKLRSLQADLVAFAESRLPNVERLWVELEESIDDFKQLLDKHCRSDASRKQLHGNKIKLGDDEYGINDEFREEVIQVADALDLDELDAARLYLDSQDLAPDFDRPPALTAIFRFHGRREILLDALRLAIQQAVELEADSEQKPIFTQVVRLITKPRDSAPSGAASAYWNRCLTGLTHIESWINRVHQRVQAAVVLGQDLNPYALEALEFQRDSLVRQHESLAIVSCLLVKDDHATLEGYRALMTQAAALEQFDVFAVHYTPILLTCASFFGGSHGPTTLRDCRGFDSTFSDTTATTAWKLRNFRAVSTAAWLAEYSGRYNENAPSSPLQHVDLEKETQSRSDRFMDTLQDGAFQWLLLVCSKLRIEQWHDPAKAGLVQFLLAEVRAEQDANMSFSPQFEDLVFRQLQLFADALIANMPDTIRRLKHEEDQQRRNAGSIAPESRQENFLHLERFLVIVAAAFQSFPDAALDAFWSDPDGNMYGFLQWASKRQSTPRAAAFCEMFRAIVGNEEAAESAHRFLMDEAVGATSARLRKSASLNWAQIFEEFGYYAARLQENPGALVLHNGISSVGQVAEAESALMLECYLRLISRMCVVSPSSRDFVLSHPDFHLHETLLDLARSSIGSRFKACAFTTLTAMLSSKTDEINKGMWEALDAWAFGIPSTRPGSTQLMASHPNGAQAIAARLSSIASGFEESSAFVGLLQELVQPVKTDMSLHDGLPFPEQLGLAYRMPGIDQYVDFVLEQAFTRVANDLPDIRQTWQLRATCLGFITTCLSTFNENLVTFANLTQVNVDAAISTSSLATYVRLHPFARLMEWMFNDTVITSLFACAHEAIDIVSAAAPDSPLVTALARSVHALNLILNLQATYFDIVRPLMRSQSTMRIKQIANLALACFEDAIVSNPRLVADLGYYCGTGHEDLTILSLRLLTTLAKSRRFSIGPSGSSSSYAGRLLTALQQDNDVDHIAAAFIAPLQLDPRELEMGVLAPGLSIKQAILSLINGFLDMSPKSPGIAHGLLGFTCTGSTISVKPGSRFDKGISLFHTIVRLYAETVGLDEDHSLPWLAALRRTASEILIKLMRSRLSQRLVLQELQDSGFFEVISTAQRTIDIRSLWAGMTSDDPDFLIDDAAGVLRDYVIERAAFFEQAGHRLRAASQLNESRQLERTRSSLLGVTDLSSGEKIANATVFDLFDFIDLNISLPLPIPSTLFMADLDFSTCQKPDAELETVYDLTLVNQLLELREAELVHAGKLGDINALQRCRDEAEVITLCLGTQNMSAAIIHAQEAALKAWVHLVVVMIQINDGDPVRKSAFVLQAMQLVLPKIDQLLITSNHMAIPLARLIYALVQALDAPSTNKAVRETSMADERLLHAFRTSLHGITSVSDDIGTREIWYQIAYCILKQSISHGSVDGKSGIARQMLKLVEHAGERLVDCMCDDAVSSSGRCRMAVLLLLGSCVQLCQTARVPIMVRLMMRLNFVSVLVDGIRGFALDFEQDGEKQDLDALLSSFQASLTLILRLAQDSEGATALLETGILGAFRDSGLFATDADIGLEIDNPQALDRFYQLLGSMLRIVTAIVLTKGQRNTQTKTQGRNFLAENRTCMQAVFKAASRQEQASSRVNGHKMTSLEDLIDDFTVLIQATDFLEFDDKPALRQRSQELMFT